MRASGRRKTRSVGFPFGPRQLIIAGNEESCQEGSAKNEEPMVNVINALISIFGAIGRCAL